jgi:hypothetical protein
MRKESILPLAVAHNLCQHIDSGCWRVYRWQMSTSPPSTAFNSPYKSGEFVTLELL